jgi:uncharacterized membrane-anchored protein YitT (DUF2179 family)
MNLKILKSYLWILVGSLITAVSINVFMVPYKIAPGGVSGIATVIYYLTGGRFSVGVTMLVLNIPLFILGLRFIGKRFIIRTFFATIVLSLIIDFTSLFTNIFIKKFLLNPANALNMPDLILYVVFGGFLMGLGLGLVFRSGATTGGTDLAARVVHHFFPSITMGQTLLMIDTAVILFAALAFQSFRLALYAIIALFVSSKIIDAVLEGVNFSKSVYIISDKSDILSKAIMNELDRGVTGLEGVGMYTGNEKKVLLCVLGRGQIPALKELVKGIDPKAFVILTDVREVLGEGFKRNE